MPYAVLGLRPVKTAVAVVPATVTVPGDAGWVLIDVVVTGPGAVLVWVGSSSPWLPGAPWCAVVVVVTLEVVVVVVSQPLRIGTPGVQAPSMFTAYSRS